METGGGAAGDLGTTPVLIRGGNQPLPKLPHKWCSPQNWGDYPSPNLRRLVGHLFAGDFACHFSRAAPVSGVSDGRA